MKPSEQSRPPLGTPYYEAERILNEYLLLHYGQANEILPYAFGPKDALDFPTRCARECCDLIDRGSQTRALEVGCAVGRASFELARCCGAVIGIDFSTQFITAAQQLQKCGFHPYKTVQEGQVMELLAAKVPQGIDPSRVIFEQGDAQDLRLDLGTFDIVLAANLIDRLHAPKKFLQRLPELVRSGGYCVLTSPYTWSEEFTPIENWLGGYVRNGEAVRTFDALQQTLKGEFALVGRKDLPFLIREHARKFQWCVAEMTIWKKERVSD